MSCRTAAGTSTARLAERPDWYVTRTRLGLIDQGVDLARVQYRPGHGDLQATTRYVKILDEEDPKAADVISAIRRRRCLELESLLSVMRDVASRKARLS